MSTHAHLESGMAILKARLTSPGEAPSSSPAIVRPFITLSREVCAGATTIGGLLIPRLNAEFGEEGQDWVLMDRDLLTYALAHHELPQQLARFLPEDKISEIDSLIGEIMGLHPSIWSLEQQVAQAIVQFAHVGHLVFVGRAGHLLTQSLPGGFHVRLVASKEIRVRRMMGEHGITAHEAEAEIDRTDLGRRRFMRSHFAKDIDDPHTYDLVINTDRICPETAASIVIEGLRNRVRTSAGAAHR
jgi:cytidylate kinase